MIALKVEPTKTEKRAESARRAFRGAAAARLGSTAEVRDTGRWWHGCYAWCMTLPEVDTGMTLNTNAHGSTPYVDPSGEAGAVNVRVRFCPFCGKELGGQT